MNAYEQVFVTPRSQWSRQLLETGFEDAIRLMQGCLRQEAEFTIEQEAVNEKKRSVNGTANVEEISRSFWLIRIDGLDIRQYKKNPIVLANHCPVAYGTLMPGAIGTVGSVSKSDNALNFKNMVFDDDVIAEAWWQKVRKNIVRMVSIGFLPLEWTYVEEPPKKKGDPYKYYIEITKSELLELSVVCIGANRGAFIDSGREGATFSSDRAEAADDNNQGRLSNRMTLIEEEIKKLSQLITSSDPKRSNSETKIAKLDEALAMVRS